MDTIRLLLIEDDEDDYFITKDLLSDVKNQRYKLDWVDDPIEAKKVLSRNEHDVCLLDYELGAEDGVTLLKEAPKLGFKGPIIMLTGQDDEYLDEEAQKAGAVDYLIKSHLNAPWLERAIRYAVSRQEMELERIDRMKAEAENRSKSEFLARLSHELRTPMTAILGYTDLIANQTQDQALLENLQIIKRNGTHLLSLLNDVLDLSKIEAGKLETESHLLALKPFLQEIYELMKVYALDKGIELILEKSPNLPEHIVTDSVRLRQILLNLLNNAIKFTHQGQVSLSATYLEEQQQLTLAVEDTGTGIEPADFELLFKPFSQLRHSESTGTNGTGLGLSISKQLAGLLGGTISVESEVGKGSKFSLVLSVDIPTKQAIEKTTPTASYYNQKNLRRQLSGNILVVDDVPDIRNLIGQIITNAGCQVCYASDGLEALSAFREAAAAKPFDLIVMDLQMPKLSGIEATQEIRKQDSQIPILALTAATMKGERERCLSAGVTDYLSKPVDPDRLITALVNYLPKRESKPVQQKRILLVEDNPDALSVTINLLEHLGYEAYPAEDGQQALKQYAKHKPDLIFIDINLPDINGFQLATKLKAQGDTSCKLIALSGEQISDAALTEAGFDDYQLKPISLDTLKAMIEAHL